MQMEDFYIELYARRSAARSDYTYAQYSNGCLSFIEGTDYHKEDYDECYGIILGKETSDKLLSIIRKDGQSIEEAVREKYSGMDILTPIEHSLKENGITYKWSSDKFELGW